MPVARHAPACGLPPPSSYRSFANTAKIKENAIALITRCMTSPH
jgi:hypothetical protein